MFQVQQNQTRGILIHGEAFCFANMSVPILIINGTISSLGFVFQERGVNIFKVSA